MAIWPNDKKEQVISDSKLESTQQQAIASLVKKLPEENLSMAWRSSLNERIRAEADKKRKQRRTRIVWSSSLGFGMAGAILLMVMVPNAIRPTSDVLPSSNKTEVLESSLYALHQESVVLGGVSSTGVAYRRTQEFDNSDLGEDEWNSSQIY